MVLQLFLCGTSCASLAVSGSRLFVCSCLAHFVWCKQVLCSEWCCENRSCSSFCVPQVVQLLAAGMDDFDIPCVEEDNIDKDKVEGADVEEIEEDAEALAAASKPSQQEAEHQEADESAAMVSSRFGRMAALMVPTKSISGASNAGTTENAEVTTVAIPQGRANPASGCAKRTGAAENQTIVIREGGKGCCKVCGLVFADMPSNCKFCHRHKRLVNSMVKRWCPKKGTNNPGQFLPNPHQR